MTGIWSTTVCSHLLYLI